MSFQQGLSGLNSSSRALDTIGNNIANSGTAGFKGANARFADVYAASLSGTGASQIGIGSNLSSVFQQFTQGNLTSTGNPLDLAINGGGFYRLSDQPGVGSGSVAYTRNGQFLLNKDGYIVNSAGLFLTGLQADPITGVVPNSGQPGALQMDTSLINPRATTTSDIGFNLDSRNALPTVTPFDPADPQTYNATTTQTVYDSLGNPHNVQLYFAKTAANTWDMYSFIDGVIPAPLPAANVLTFDTSGRLTQIDGVAEAPIPMSFAVTTGAVTPLAFTMDIGRASQYGEEFGVTSLSQDGYTTGRLTGIVVSSDGTVQGQYSNGRTKAMGRLVLDTFQNPNGLQNMGGNIWRETAESGQPIEGVPGQGNLGVIQSATVEDSNVDLTGELVAMIVQQRAYQANAQTIKTQDQVLQTLVNLR
jgi:flagellar hook protein FlgE